MTAAAPLLAAEGLSFRYSRKHPVLFRDVGLDLGPGQAISILGPNGVGKTTLLNCLVGARRPSAGRIVCGGADLGVLRPRQVARRLAVVHQMHESTFSYTVQSIVLLGRAAHIGLFGQPGRHDHMAAQAAMQRVGVARLAQRPFGELSGGERQLVLIARALVQEAPVMVLDEPTSHLDLANQGRVLALLRELMEEGQGILMTSHFPEHALMLGGEALLLGKPEGSVAGPVDTVVTEANLAAAYNAPVALLRDGAAIACAPRLG
ncbi:ABC transporter ATP-binding protein [Pelagibius sp. CAU 1746]|uniref:ABC transporter ATP-binding protein n=1 Tax=Pelagibius sp. CAU 1746 TaxID=3140370 RepID=UPI00325A4EDB